MATPNTEPVHAPNTPSLAVPAAPVPLPAVLVQQAVTAAPVAPVGTPDMPAQAPAPAPMPAPMTPAHAPVQIAKHITFPKNAKRNLGRALAIESLMAMVRAGELTVPAYVYTA